MSYLDALQRTQQSQDGTSSGYVETDIRKPSDPNVRALKKAKYKTLFESLTPKERMEIRKKLEARKKMRLEKAKPINDNFKRRATQNQKRTESIISDKEDQMKAMRDAEVKEQDKIERQREKQASKEERAQERKDSTFVDFDSIGIYVNKVQNRLDELQAELSLEEQSYMAKNAITDKDGRPTLLPIQQSELDAKLNVIKRKIENLQSEREIEIQQRVNEVAFKALRKFNNVKEVERRFRNAGLLKYYLNYAENEQARIK
tara:strand:+ start:10801 stop:11580 length:780 start_codon:yes stop_codon:yes gene_type:complete